MAIVYFLLFSSEYERSPEGMHLITYSCYNSASNWRKNEIRREFRMITIGREKGQGLIEYAFIIVLIALVTIAVLALLGPAITQTYQTIISTI
jgi:Flp pilus assembly pilin Flp